jgi:hypothetical protein
MRGGDHGNLEGNNSEGGGHGPHGTSILEFGGVKKNHTNFQDSRLSSRNYNILPPRNVRNITDTLTRTTGLRNKAM